MNKILKISIEFLPIVIIFLLVSYTETFVIFSHTVLGRLFSILLILFYIKIDPTIGLFVCALVIFYYHSDYVEGMRVMLNNNNFVEGMNSDSSGNGSQKNIMNLYNSEKGLIESFKSQDSGDNSSDKKRKTDDSNDEETTMILSSDQMDEMSGSFESFQNVNDAYATEKMTNLQSSGSFDVIDTFRKSNCVKGELVNKGQIIKSEMADHIFPEVHFKNGKCNVCKSTCEFDILKDRMSAQEELLLPKDSNDWVTRVWENMKSSAQ